MPVKLTLAVMILMLSGCGYRLAARKGDTEEGRTIAVPTFVNRTKAYRIEQRMSEALRRELSRSTGYRVTSASTGDVVVAGEVLEYVTSPVVFTEPGRASQYAVSFDLKIVVTDTSSGAVLYQNDRMAYREIFQLAQNSGDFVPEDPAAWQRLASQLASSLVASLVHRAP
jgi:outer membrane lipopolysaccharide assembly protein LptE/RlpB